MESRAHLQMKFGNEVRVNCRNCGKFEKKHINRISAIVDQRLVFGGFITGLTFGVIFCIYILFIANASLSFWKAIAAFGGAIAGIPVFLWNRENTAVGNFNRYAIRR